MTRCDRCHRPITAEESALSWPVAVTPEDGDPSEDIEYVCPDCYGAEAYNDNGELLPGDEE